MKKFLNVLLALVMIASLVPFAFAENPAPVYCEITENSSGNIVVTYYGKAVTKLTNAVFAVDFNTSVFKLVSARAATTEIDGDQYTNFPGMWASGMKGDGSGATAGFISGTGASKKNTVAICSFELKLINEHSPNDEIRVYLNEFVTDDGNTANDVTVGSPVLLATKRFNKVLPGDLNGDGALDVLDAEYFEQYLSGHVVFTKEELALAEMNGDGKVNYRDYYLLIAVKGVPIVEYDVNGDGVVDVLDISIFEKAFVRKTAADSREFRIGDIDCDGEFSASDYAFLVNYALSR